MQLFAGISRNAQSKSYMLSFTECVWDFQNSALKDTHWHALFGMLTLKLSSRSLKIPSSDAYDHTQISNSDW